MARINKSIIRGLGHGHRLLWRLFGGRVGNTFASVPFLMLTTKGRKSGRRRTTPVLYLTDGEDYFIVASFGGHDTHPVWYLNLEANPEAEIVVKGRHIRVRAERLDAEEKRQVWSRLVAMFRFFDQYQKATDRDIPVIALRPIKG